MARKIVDRKATVDATALTRSVGAKDRSVAAAGGARGGSDRTFGPGGVNLGNKGNSGLAANTGNVRGSARRNAGVGAGAPGRVVPNAKRVGKGGGANVTPMGTSSSQRKGRGQTVQGPPFGARTRGR